MGAGCGRVAVGLANWANFALVQVTGAGVGPMRQHAALVVIADPLVLVHERVEVVSEGLLLVFHLPTKRLYASLISNRFEQSLRQNPQIFVLVTQTNNCRFGEIFHLLAI